MAADADRTEDDEGASAAGLGRLLAFSDGVFAIAITILVLDIDVPDGLAYDGLVAALTDQLANLAAAALSFAVIGRFWVAHHAMFGVIRRSDHRLLALNLLLLGPIVLLPFVTKLLADYGAVPLVVIAYAGTVAAVALAELAIFGYATRGRRLVDQDLPPVAVRNGLARQPSSRSRSWRRSRSRCSPRSPRCSAGSSRSCRPGRCSPAWVPPADSLAPCRGSWCWTTGQATCAPPSARCAGWGPTSR